MRQKERERQNPRWDGNGGGEPEEEGDEWGLVREREGVRAVWWALLSLVRAARSVAVLDWTGVTDSGDGEQGGYRRWWWWW